MAIKDLDGIKETLADVSAALAMIDFDFPLEPRDDADAETWRDYGLAVADKLAEAEKVVDKAVESIDA